MKYFIKTVNVAKDGSFNIPEEYELVHVIKRDSVMYMNSIIFNDYTNDCVEKNEFKEKAIKCLSSLTSEVAWNKKFKNWMNWMLYFQECKR